MDEPIGRFAADVRVSLPRFKQLPDVAVWYSVADTDLPTWGRGLEAGAHVYPLAWRFITFGVGGAVLLARAHHGLTELDGYVTGHVVDVQFTSVSSHVSLNFGKNSGWSYLSGGLGWSWMAITTRAEPIDATARSRRFITEAGRGGFPAITSDSPSICASTGSVPSRRQKL